MLRCAIADHLVHHGDQERLLAEEGLSPATLHARLSTFCH
jgi:hypothetical protein